MSALPNVVAAPAATRSLSIVIAGSGGAGVMTAGQMLLQAAAAAGRYGLMVRTAGPQIRGGESAALLRIADHEVSCLDDRVDVLVALDWDNVERFVDEIPLDAHSIVISDPAGARWPEAFARAGAAHVPLSFAGIAAAHPGSWPNMAALGVAAGVLGLPLPVLQSTVERATRRGRDAIEASQAAAADGWRAGAAIVGVPKLHTPGDLRRHWLITGNEAAGLGALRGGVRFVAAYPITPATELLEWMAPALAECGGTLVQAEDELASVNMAIGAAYSGVPALTATAGPGLSLMTEALGLAVSAEIPLVVVDVMRGGPSTGIPAKSEQSDLNIAVHGTHGDAPRIVVAPSSVADCAATTQWAVELAETLQAPALVLSDQFLGQTRAIVDPLIAAVSPVLRKLPAVAGDGAGVSATPGGTAPAVAPYRRYADTADGVSPMARPGVPGFAYTAEGLEHNERGIPSSGAREHHRQLDKRLRKLLAHDYGTRWADIEGEGTLAVITFGSCCGPVREAVERLRGDGLAVRFVGLRLLAPLQADALQAALAGVKRALVVELNHGAQLRGWLRAGAELPPLASLARPGPLPLRPGEVIAALRALATMNEEQ